jgi:hypothetical protein
MATEVLPNVAPGGCYPVLRRMPFANATWALARKRCRRRPRRGGANIRFHLRAQGLSAIPRYAVS